MIIKEVGTTNLSGAADQAGKKGDWVELYNTTPAAVDLTGWGLSNTVKSPASWLFPATTSIPAKSYLRVWADKADRTASRSNLHTNFNIDNGADAVALSAPNQTALGQLVDSTTPPFTRPDVSWCRTPNGDPKSTWTTCLTPTPGAANSGSTATGLLSTPTLSLASGVYSGTQTVAVTVGTAPSTPACSCASRATAASRRPPRHWSPGRSPCRRPGRCRSARLQDRRPGELRGLRHLRHRRLGLVHRTADAVPRHVPRRPQRLGGPQPGAVGSTTPLTAPCRSTRSTCRGG